MQRLQKNSGFTLIELSIVLVIIGLIIGAVLAGKELIHAAEIRKTVRQTEQFDTAINAFKLKYNCLPGDCANAYAFGFTNYDGSAIPNAASSNNGNGDGMIWQTTANPLEVGNAFWWLQQAGFISGVTASPYFPSEMCNIPTAISGGDGQGEIATWNVMYVDLSLFQDYPKNKFFNHAGHYYYLSADALYGNNADPTAIIPADAYAIDAKIDDGLPRSGKVLASGNGLVDLASNLENWAPVSDPTAQLGATDEGIAGANSNFCVTGPPPAAELYNVQNTNQPKATNGINSLCTLTVEGSFNMQRLQKNSGFTLIELSIVLVIIGLIIGAVLAGKELIHAAEIRKTIRQTEEFDTAINAFQIKYNCLPGDCANATQFGFSSALMNLDGTYSTVDTPSTPINGNGDGIISAGVSSYEADNAWWQLQQAGLVSGTEHQDGIATGGMEIMPTAIAGGRNSPMSIWSKASWGVTYVDTSLLNANNVFFPSSASGHYYWLFSSDLHGQGATTAILPQEAYEIDSKIDDGLPRSGRVLASGNLGPDSSSYAPVSDPYGNISSDPDEGLAGANSNYCVTGPPPATELYNVQNTSRANDGNAVDSLCTLAVKASF